MSLRHLIIGASGLVGGHLLRALERAGEPVSGTYCSDPLPNLLHLDMKDPQEVGKVLDQIRPEVVYLPASNPNVEWCEEHPDEAYEVNVQATQRAIEAIVTHGGRAVFFSTDYVFDGRNGPYTEEATPHPMNVYGRHKLMVERFLLNTSPQSLVVRTTVVYGVEKKQKNFVYSLLKRHKNGEVMKVPVDQVSSPTYAYNAAQLTVQLALKGQAGIFNVVGKDIISRYEFALKAAEIFGLDKALIQPITTDQLNQKAPRPLRAGLLVDKAVAATDLPALGVEAGLSAFKQELETPEGF